MTIQNGDIFVWTADDADKYYFVEHDLASINDNLRGLHWCRIYFEPKNGKDVDGYKTVLSREYFADLTRAVGQRLARIEDAQEIEKLNARFAHLKAPLRHRD